MYSARYYVWSIINPLCLTLKRKNHKPRKHVKWIEEKLNIHYTVPCFFDKTDNEKLGYVPVNPKSLCTGKVNYKYVIKRNYQITCFCLTLQI